MRKRGEDESGNGEGVERQGGWRGRMKWKAERGREGGESE